jgi:hypothetical protein
MKWIRTIALMLPFSLSLMAQEPATSQQDSRKPQGRGNPAQMDTDRDGKISSAEWRGPAEAFKRLDADNDGYVSREELYQRRRQNGTRGADANNDGRITRDEWKGMPEIFDRLDANHDGAITPDERPRTREGLRGKRPPAGRGENPGQQ